MEAPKKIYFTSNENGTHYYTEGIPFEREYIEYVSKDAFIEKALKWIIENYHDYDHRDEFDVKGLVLDFKEYMKGE